MLADSDTDSARNPGLSGGVATVLLQLASGAGAGAGVAITRIASEATERAGKARFMVSRRRAVMGESPIEKAKRPRAFILDV